MTVTVSDVFGNFTTSTSSITIAITAGTGTSGATLRGTTTVSAVSGTATFSCVSVSLVGTGYTLISTSPGLVSAVSSSFNVAIPPPTITSVPSEIDAVFGTVHVTNTGTNFVSGSTTVAVGGGVGLTTSGFSAVDASTMTGDFNIASAPASASLTLSATTPSGTSSPFPFNLYFDGSAPLQTGPSNGDSGGSPYSLDCGAGEFVTGLNVRGGSNVDALQVVCQSIGPAAREFGSPTTTAAVGGGGGSPSTLSCPANYVMTGLTGRIGSGGVA
ncbi:MAG: hypothetical protein ABI442_11235 [Gemmatimonadaceae bacterium]